MTTITLDKHRTARFTQRTAREFHEAQATASSDIGRISLLIFWSLKADDPTLTLEALEDILDASSIGPALAAASAEIDKYSVALNPPNASEAQTLTGNVN